MKKTQGAFFLLIFSYWSWGHKILPGTLVHIPIWTWTVQCLHKCDPRDENGQWCEQDHMTFSSKVWKLPTVQIKPKVQTRHHVVFTQNSLIILSVNVSSYTTKSVHTLGLVTSLALFTPRVMLASWTSLTLLVLLAPLTLSALYIMFIPFTTSTT